MDLALLFFAFLWGLAGRGGAESPGDIKQPARPRQLPPPPPPARGGQVSTPPWPQVTPAGLPPFPGPGWEFDEPPPRAVTQRAGQLVSALWRGGAGTFKTEQTGGRWITYRAEIVASGKKGVVAYREKRASAPRAPRASAPRASAPRASAPRASAPRASAPRASSSAPAPVAMTLLRRGMGIKPQAPHPQVALAQRKLGIKDDGQFGAGTEAAVIAFQRSRGLNPDGIVGPKTWAALFAVQRA